jgi:hypothetical protein
MSGPAQMRLFKDYTAWHLTLLERNHASAGPTYLTAPADT